MPELTYKEFLSLFLLLLLPGQIWAAHCTVFQIAVIAGSWKNTGNKTSLTLQTQDSGGASCHVAQTLRFSLTSSAAGSFTGQTGNALQFYISTNNANRNFYYDGHPASYTLTAKAGYGAADSWTEQFSTTYGNGDSSGSSTSTPVEESAGGSSSAGQSGDSSFSVHYSATSLSNKTPEATVELSAGRDRLGSVGTPLEFKVETNLPRTQNSNFKWNFGDGNEAYGDTVAHAYEYPGDYVVVLNTVLSQGQAVARTNVRIIEPDIGVTLATPARIELKNNSKFEISLFGRALWVGGSAFVFPQDTIIKAGQSISFGSKVTGLRPNGIQDAQIMVIGNTEQAKIWKKIKEQKEEKIVSIQTRLSELKQQLASMSSSPPNLAVQQLSTGTSSEKVEIMLPQTALAKEGWLQTLKKFFLRTK